ncbi:MAG TPA: lycopene cyclase family protein [Chitinophagaceae bacterium]|nr:lycopene cyclase family protein [Chitinophagaceae bacterium]
MNLLAGHSPREGQYDYIITGAGAAGLSLLVHLIRSGRFSDKRILLIDREDKNKNDRTWCFWEEEAGLFEPIVFRSWEKAWFHGPGFSRLMDLAPYRYKMIRGVDFYRYCMDLVREQPGITFLKAPVKDLASLPDGVRVTAGDQEFRGRYLFNSILFDPVRPAAGQYYLLQHFTGWVVETAEDRFQPGEAVLMDFRVSQQAGTTFVYVMPFSPRSALVEFTLFSEKILEPAAYAQGLRDYLARFLQVQDFRIAEEEFGVIPMTNYPFPPRDGNIIHIGTAGGQTKASSGYTFRFIQKHAASLVERLIRTGDPFAAPVSSRRFHFYDSTLLHILSHGTLPGASVFTQLFQKNRPRDIFRFLDNESSWREELRIISSLPTRPFLAAALKQL